MDFVNQNWPIISLVILVAGVAWRARGWVSSVDTKIENVEKGIKEISDFLGTVFRSTIVPNSPISLTDLGLEISKTLNASQWAKSEAIKLVREENLRSKKPSHYIIERHCFDIIEGRVEATPMQESVEKCAYKKGLKKQQVLDVLAVELRDALFEQLGMDKDANY